MQHKRIKCKLVALISGTARPLNYGFPNDLLSKRSSFAGSKRSVSCSVYLYMSRMMTIQYKFSDHFAKSPNIFFILEHKKRRTARRHRRGNVCVCLFTFMKSTNPPSDPLFRTSLLIWNPKLMKKDDEGVDILLNQRTMKSMFEVWTLFSYKKSCHPQGLKPVSHRVSEIWVPSQS